MQSWIERIKHRLGLNQPVSAPRGKRRGARLQLEMLENRITPAAPVFSLVDHDLLLIPEQTPTAVAPALSLTDGDGAGLEVASATVQITPASYQSGEDILSFDNSLLGTVTTSGFDASTGSITFTGEASASFYQDLLRSVTFQDNKDAPNTATTRTISFTVDGPAADPGSTSDSRDVSVTAVNDAPSGANKTVAFLEDTTYTFTTADFGFTDPSDSPANNLTAVKITTLPAAGTLNLDGVAVTLGQFVSAADIASGKLVFTPGANGSGANYTTFTFQVQDDGGTPGVDLDPSPKTITVDLTVGANASTTKAGTSDGPSTMGQSVLLTMRVGDSLNVATFGTVTFFEGATNLGTGKFNPATGNWELLLSNLPQGSHTITATYSGNSFYAGSTSAVGITQVVNAVGMTASTTSDVTSSDSSAGLGESVKFSVRVGNSVNIATSGTVTFLDGATNLGTGTFNNSTGQWELTVSTLTVGNHNITASFTGNATFAASASSTPLVQSVSAAGVTASTTSAVTSSSNASGVSEAVLFSATVGGASGIATFGTVTFFDGATSLGAGKFNGATNNWELLVSDLAVGSHSITATFGGNSTYASSASSPALTQTVNAVGSHAAMTGAVSSSDSTSTVGQPVTFSVKVSDSTDVVTYGTVTFLDGATSLGAGTFNSVTGNWELIVSSLAAGAHNISASFGGNYYYSGSTSLPPLLVQTVA